MPASPASTETDLATRLRFAVGRLNRRLRAETGERRTPTELSILYVIEQRGPIALGALAAGEHLTPPSLTRILNNLEEAGLIRRDTDRSDRRSVVASLTRRGASLIDKMRAQKDGFLSSRLAALDPDERALLTKAADLLEKLAEDEH
jgi:DNA-binding MarR family transcriptional regulator